MYCTNRFINTIHGTTLHTRKGDTWTLKNADIDWFAKTLTGFPRCISFVRGECALVKLPRFLLSVHMYNLSKDVLCFAYDQKEFLKQFQTSLHKVTGESLMKSNEIFSIILHISIIIINIKIIDYTSSKWIQQTHSSHDYYRYPIIIISE